MNFRLSIAFICILLVAAQVGGAQSIASESVVAVDLSVPFGSIPGKLLLLGNYLVFVDEQQPSASFVVAKSTIESLNAEGPSITVQISETIRNRSGDVRRLSFRVASGTDPTIVASWYEGGIASASSTASAVIPTSGMKSYQARHNHRFGECRGRLIVGPDQVGYESVSSVSHSRRWEYQAIKETKLANPYELEIKPFSGDTYRFYFDGAGMDPAAYRDLVNRVTSSRAGR